MNVIKHRLRGYRAVGGPTVYCGADALTELPNVVPHGRRVLLVSSRSVATETPLVGQVKELLGSSYAGVFTGSRAHTRSDSVSDGVAAFRDSGADALVSLGGSSVVDTAKAIALVSAVGEDLAPYRGSVTRRASEYVLGRGRMDGETPGAEKIPPHIAIPTTLSGAEFTFQIGLTDQSTNIKDQYFHSWLLPETVIFDPKAAAWTPQWLWLSTGVKVLDHAIEIICAKDCPPPSEAACLAAVGRVFTDLTASADPGAIGARQSLQVAAWLAVSTYPNSRAGIGHALDHQLGGLFQVPHGIAACCILPHAMRFNHEAAADRLVLVARAIKTTGWPIEGMTPEGAVGAVVTLIARLGLPSRLRDVGIERSDLPRLAEATLNDSGMAGNPRIVGDAEEVLTGLLEPAW